MHKQGKVVEQGVSALGGRTTASFQRPLTNFQPYVEVTEVHDTLAITLDMPYPVS